VGPFWEEGRRRGGGGWGGGVDQSGRISARVGGDTLASESNLKKRPLSHSGKKKGNPEETGA